MGYSEALLFNKLHKKIVISLVIVCLILSTSGTVYSQPKEDKLTELNGQIRQLLKSSPLKKAKVGIQVVSLSDGKTIFVHNPELPLIPASNMKILTTVAALARLGTDYRFKTGVYSDNKIRQGKLSGNLYFKGFGDPFLVWEEVVKIARYIHGLGLRQLEGDIVADESFLDSKRYGNGWEKEQHAYWYNAPLGALSVNFNTVEVNIAPGLAKGDPLKIWLNPATSFFKLENKGVTSKRNQKLQLAYVRRKNKPTLLVKGYMPVGRSPHTFYRSIDDPPIYAATVFKDLLELWGVKVKGRVRVGNTPANADKLYIHESKPLTLILRGLNKYSNNFTAELVLKTLGAETKGIPGTAEKGIEVVKEVLTSLRIDHSKLTMVGGSGLSRKNQLTAKAICEVLIAIHHNFKWQPEFMASLPLAGVDGTLERRMNGNGTMRHVRAKTGRIKKVAALSGYLNTKDKETWAFSMLMNDFDTTIEQVQAIQDKLCRLMINFSKK